MAGFQSSGNSSGRSSRTCPLRAWRIPASTSPATLVFLAVARVFASPNGAVPKPWVSYQATAQRVSLSSCAS